MILDITIDGLGVIDHAELPLGPGFTAITGETGAGKTMVVTALGLLLGGRANSGSVRGGASKAVVDGRWAVPSAGPVAEIVDDAGGELEDAPASDYGELLVSRQITAEGRSRAWAGGRSVPASVLVSLGEHLVAIHGQSEQWRLRSESAQRDALDAFGGDAIATALRDVRERHAELASLRERLEALQTSEDERAREAEHLREAIAAIEPVDPQPGEDAELLARIERLSNREALRREMSAAHALIRGADDAAEFASVTELLARARGHLEAARSNDHEVTPILEALESVGFAVDDLAIRLSGYLTGLDSEGVGELPELDARLGLLTELNRRYGPTLDDVLEFYSRGSMRLLELDSAGDQIEALEEQVETAQAALEEAATGLSALRIEAASRLERIVTGELSELAMPNARVTVEVADRGEVTSRGRDRITFLLQPHPGSAPTPIAKGASGGELARVMLALEVALAGANPVPTLVFDEIDAGIGGAAAIEVGRRLRALSENAQVIAVTHLAQVAAFATNHLRIEKASDGEITSSSIHQLTGTERTGEIARLLSGLADSETGLAHAEELLALAEGAPQSDAQAVR